MLYSKGKIITMLHQPVKVLIHDHAYSTWSYTYPDSKQDLSNQEYNLPPPLIHHWFNQDVIDFTDQDSPHIIHSPLRNTSYIPGVLILEGNRTYGRTKNRKRLLYRCIPDDRHLPHFFVPYDIIMDFSKAHLNKYVLFKYQEWTDQHPHGILVETLGDVNCLEAFYEYQLYLKSLHGSVKEMTQKIKDMTKKKTFDEYFEQIKENTNYMIHDLTLLPEPPQILTIDPPNTVDFDDGLSITTCPKTNDICVTVYIANVVFWLDTFQLWNSFDNRIATIYLPDRRRPMLPSILSESLCSLKENTKRFAIAIQFYITNPMYSSVWAVDDSRTVIRNVVISPYKNYAYEEPKLLYQDKNYIQLLDTTVRFDSHVKNSRDLITYWMVKTNSYMAQYMIQHKTGIFRVGKFMKVHTYSDGRPKEVQRNMKRIEENAKCDDIDDEEDDTTPEESINYEHLDSETKKYLEYHAKAQSICYNDDLNLEHEVLNKKAYMRITSVIRRYEDICNESELMKLMGVKLRGMDGNGINIKEYYNEELFNERYRNIKRIESESVMMKRTYMGENKVMGVLYSRRLLDDGRYEYKVYIKGEGIKDVRIRDRLDLYKEYELRRYIKERGGGLRVKLEFPLDTLKT